MHSELLCWGLSCCISDELWGISFWFPSMETGEQVGGCRV